MSHATYAVKTRFASSPTGYLHLGNARTALFSYLLAQHMGATFLLRIEDTDSQRDHEPYREALLDDLRWLGCAWDEGPECDRGAGPYRQSQRGDIYRARFDRLMSDGLAYRCFCSEQELHRVRAAQRRAGRLPRYPGTCAALPEAQSRARAEAGEPYSLRFRVPPGERIESHDLIRGPQHFATDDIGDFVICRSNGTAAFFFSNALDDALMGVTHVVRDEDHLSNTPRQLMLLQALNLPQPSYAHLPLLLGDNSAPLSKRNGSVSLHELRARGYLASALTNYLARTGHTYADDHLLDRQALGAGLDLARISRSGARFDWAQIDHWQRRALDQLSTTHMLAWLDEQLADAAHWRALADDEQCREALALLVRPNVQTGTDARYWIDRLLLAPTLTGEAAAAVSQAQAGYFEAALETLSGERGEFVGRIKARTGLKGRRLFMPLRAAITGELHGPELGGILALLPESSLRERLLRARGLARGGPVTQ